MKNNERYRKTLEIVFGAVLMIFIAAIFLYVFMTKYDDVIFYYRKGNYVLVALYALEYIIFSSLYGGSKLESANVLDIVTSNLIAILITNGLMYIIISLIAFRFIPVPWFIMMTVAQVIVVSLIALGFVKYYVSHFPPRKAILLYKNNDNRIYDKLLKYQVKNFNIEKTLNIDTIDDQLKAEIAKYETVILVNESEEVKELVAKSCFEANKQVFIVPSIYDVLINNGKVMHWIDTPMLKINHIGPQQIEKLIKRLMDIIVSIIVILVIWPIMLVVAIAIKLEDHGPVIYSQTRLTQYGKEFKIHKFRSMRVDAEKGGVAQFAKENDDRITKVGKVIRKLRLDELPQIINILNGDMSLVGPRPERPEIAQKIYEKFPEFEYRLKVKAGLTGYAQVYGKYNTTLRDKLLLDLLYIENYSVLVDIKLILMTIKIIFMKDSTEGVEEANSELNI